MPGFDGTGPSGRGPMTGWGRGRCMAYGVPAAAQGQAQVAAPFPPGYAPPAYYGLGRGGIPRGCGRGFGGGRRRRCFW
ncbi:MAG TPA: DUF5320 domain-containing protein [Methanolinea sp.]|nr:DUF5320 domain-containing protein [Methanolinea sp.]HNS83344.1 DUF5320 domain-containing protein [Methanolinea sp.]